MEQRNLDSPDWKNIALELAKRVNFAIIHLKATGAGVVGSIDTPTNEWKHWRRYMAEGLELLPGYKVDWEMLDTLDLPKAKRIKAQQSLKLSRTLKESQNA